MLKFKDETLDLLNEFHIDIYDIQGHINTL